MRANKKAIAAAAVCAVLALMLAGCGSKSAQALSISDVYSQEDFAAETAEIAKVKSDNVNFAENGNSGFTIVYPSQIDVVETYPDGERVPQSESDKAALKSAVAFLTNSLSKIVGHSFTSVPDGAFDGGLAFRLILDKSVSGLDEDGFILKISQEAITITAREYMGLEYGIYTFLEDCLGCMFVTEDYDYLPTLPTINFSAIEKTYTSDIKWRAIYAYESLPLGNKDESGLQWCQKLKLNGAGNRGWMHWCHTFFTYIPPKEYFDAHPEYFSEYDGKRKYENGPVSGQLCLTNEDVYNIVSEKMFTLMTENPEMKYWDFSQMDTWINRGTGCTCENCKKLDDAEGSPMGSLLTFINRLADECAERFPDNYISTLAYNYSAVPPKTLRPRDNVIIKLCLMPGDVASGVANPRGDEAQTSKEIIETWGKISKNLLVWDYNINFHQYMMPYPIYSALQENNDFYLDNNVYGIFHQMDRDKGGYSAEMSAYVFAKLMWDRDTDVEKLLSKYMGVTYGNAAKYMAEYYSALEQNAYDANRPLYIYSTVYGNSFDYLSNGKVKKYLKLFEQAEATVADQPEILARVQKAKIGALYVKAQEVSLDLKGKKAALEEWKTLCDRFEIDSLYEGNPDKDNEAQTFYDTQSALIGAAPWIIVGSVVLLGAIVTGTVFGIRALKKKKRAASQKQNSGDNPAIDK